MSRRIAILHDDMSMRSNVLDAAKKLHEAGCTDITVFTKEADESFSIQELGCKNAVWPAECDTVPKIRNWINAQFKQQEFSGMLHVLEDTTCILKDPKQFMDDVEHAMDVLDYDVWLSTSCDPCNFVYRKYNPRLDIVLDRAELFKLGLGTRILFTSHSNLQWVVYNFAKVPDSLLHLDEQFTVPMYYIIEFLARRRNTKQDGQAYFMNQYMTVESENGVFRNALAQAKQDDPKVMQEEDEKFKSMDINFASDNSVDAVLEAVWKKLSEKAA